MGTTWTLELRSVVGPLDDAAPVGPVVDWISSGVPTELATPEDEAVDLLGDRGLLLFPDEEPEDASRSRSRRRIGYVTRDSDVLQLALLLAEMLDEGPAHPMVLAAGWIKAGYSVQVAAGLIASGVSWPDAAHTLLASGLDPSLNPSRPSVARPAARPAVRSATRPGTRSVEARRAG